MPMGNVDVVLLRLWRAMLISSHSVPTTEYIIIDIDTNCKGKNRQNYDFTVNGVLNIQSLKMHKSAHYT